MSTSSVRAETITQIECLQWLVQVTGEAGQFASSSTAADLIQWARVKGVNPTGGWQPNALLTSQALAEILVQMMGINPNKRGGDYIKILEREGIIIPSGDITREALVNVLGADPVQRRVGPPSGVPPFGLPPGPPQGVPPVSPHRKGNNGKGNGDDPPPPGWTNPRNPHFDNNRPNG